MEGSTRRSVEGALLDGKQALLLDGFVAGLFHPCGELAGQEAVEGHIGPLELWVEALAVFAAVSLEVQDSHGATWLQVVAERLEHLQRLRNVVEGQVGVDEVESLTHAAHCGRVLVQLAWARDQLAGSVHVRVFLGLPRELAHHSFRAVHAEHLVHLRSNVLREEACAAAELHAAHLWVHAQSSRQALRRKGSPLDDEGL
mmetsp:Transcript_9007/g.37144  ORF Transcript_9007/g.37144 Transcript_9007/m.37144 type:complete len:200 (-) Transcript_9007:83-682(-)